MDELKQYRLELPAAMARAIVFACVAAGIAALGAVALEFQASSAIQHADVRLSGLDGVLPVMAATVANVDTQAQAALTSVGVRIGRSLDGADRQVATIGPVARSIQPALDGLTHDEAKLGDSLDRVSHACAPGPCGTLADVGKTLNTVRGTFGEIEIAANHEDRNLTTLDAQENTLFEDFHGTATRANSSLDTFNALLANPNLALTEKNLADITTTTSQVEAKLAKCTLHPTLPCVFKADAIFAAQVGGYLLR